MDNYSSYLGAGIGCHGSKPIISNVVFINNSGGGGGLGLKSSGSHKSYATVTNSVFYNNGENNDIKFIESSQGIGNRLDISYSMLIRN